MPFDTKRCVLSYNSISIRCSWVTGPAQAFGDHISVYDTQRSVQDRATVPIYYESRLARLAVDDRQKPHIDGDFEEATEGEEVERKENVRAKLRTMVRRILRRHGYPPDKQEKATQTVLEQAEALSAIWATAA